MSLTNPYPAAAFTKAPGALLDYTIDYTRDGPMPAGDTIQSATVDADAGITVDSAAFAGLKHTIWLAGGTLGSSYKIVSKIVTVGGRKDERTIQIDVQQT